MPLLRLQEPLRIRQWIDVLGYGHVMPMQILRKKHIPDSWVYTLSQPGLKNGINTTVKGLQELPPWFIWDKFNSYPDPYSSSYVDLIEAWQVDQGFVTRTSSEPEPVHVFITYDNGDVSYLDTESTRYYLQHVNRVLEHLQRLHSPLMPPEFFHIEWENIDTAEAVAILQKQSTHTKAGWKPRSLRWRA